MAAPIGNRFAANAALSPMERFLRNCTFDPGTGCVIWTGGTTSGQGHNSPYGSFWFEGRRWFAHRWAAKHIHGQEIDGMQVDHCCPHIPYPNTLCVEHVQPKTLLENRELQTLRRNGQTIDDRRHYVHVQVGLLQPRPDAPEPFTEAPWFDPPSWLRGPVVGDCPF